MGTQIKPGSPSGAVWRARGPLCFIPSSIESRRTYTLIFCNWSATRSISVWFVWLFVRLDVQCRSMSAISLSGPKVLDFLHEYYKSLKWITKFITFSFEVFGTHLLTSSHGIRFRPPGTQNPLTLLCIYRIRPKAIWDLGTYLTWWQQPSCGVLFCTCLLPLGTSIKYVCNIWIPYPLV